MSWAHANFPLNLTWVPTSLFPPLSLTDYFSVLIKLCSKSRTLTKLQTFWEGGQELSSEPQASTLSCGQIVIDWARCALHSHLWEQLLTWLVFKEQNRALFLCTPVCAGQCKADERKRQTLEVDIEESPFSHCFSFSFLFCQSVAELEQKWQSEVEDAMHGKLENNAPFFYDYHFNEVGIVHFLIGTSKAWGETKWFF